MSQHIPLIAALLAVAVPASASAQWRPHQPGRRGPPARNVLQVPYGTRVVDVSDRTDITELGHLPPTVEVLNVRGTSIRSIRYLPAGLRNLDISRTPIRQLPHLPQGLHTLRARNGALRQLPYLPHGLRRLDVAGSQLTRLSFLPPNLVSLNVSRTPLRALPPLPHRLQELRARQTEVRVGYIPPSVTVLEGPFARPAPRRVYRGPGRYEYERRERRGRATVRVRRPGAPVVQTTNQYDTRWERARRRRAL